MDETTSTNQQQANMQTVQPQNQSGGGISNKGIAILSYFVFFLPYLTGHSHDNYVMTHANNSLILLIIYVAGSFIPFVNIFVWIAVFILWIFGVISAAQGQTKELPLIGGIHILKA